jgi:hypothetical protein
MGISLESVEPFRSVEIIWIFWVVSIVLLWIKTRQLVRSPFPGTWREFLAEESGAAYTLSYVFSFPIYMTLVCTVIETSLVLVVKIGTMYACYAGARSASVWLPAKPEIAAAKIERAVVQAFTPFAEGNPVHTQRLGVSPTMTSAGFEYHAAYAKYAANRARAPREYLARKYSFAEKALTVHWTPANPVENQDITLTVTYQMPLHIPGAARILGHPNGRYPITSRAILQNEGPKRESGFNPDRPMGIDYRSLP